MPRVIKLKKSPRKSSERFTYCVFQAQQYWWIKRIRLKQTKGHKEGWIYNSDNGKWYIIQIMESSWRRGREWQGLSLFSWSYEPIWKPVKCSVRVGRKQISIYSWKILWAICNKLAMGSDPNSKTTTTNEAANQENFSTIAGLVLITLSLSPSIHNM